MRERLLGAATVVVLVAGIVAGVARDGSGSKEARAGDEVALPGGPLGERIEQVLAFVNTGAHADDLQAIFAPHFLEVIPETQLVALAETQLRPAGPYRVTRVVQTTDDAAALIVRGPGATLAMRLRIEPSEPHRVTELLFEPGPAESAARPRSWNELDERLRSAAPEVAFLAAEVVAGACQPVHAIEPDRPLALGSAFKLYVLGAAARAVAEGRASWDDSIPIRDELRVHSSATYGETAAGTAIALRDLATAMISVSDNTATDHVMDRVGRGAVEAEQARLGMSDPSTNAPFLTTREFSLLKLGRSTDARDAYLAGDEAARRAILDQLPATGATFADLTTPAGPVAVDTIEWFATPADLCRAHVALQAMGEVVREILAVNPGVPQRRDAWPYVAYKGGSEPGVLALSWYAEREDGRRFVIAALLRDTGGDVSAFVVDDVAAAFDLLAATP